MSIWTAPITAGGGTRPTITVKPSSKADVGVVALEYAGVSTVSDASVLDRSSVQLGNDRSGRHGLLGSYPADDGRQRARDRLLPRLRLRRHTRRRLGLRHARQRLTRRRHRAARPGRRRRRRRDAQPHLRHRRRDHVAGLDRRPPARGESGPPTLPAAPTRSGRDSGEHHRDASLGRLPRTATARSRATRSLPTSARPHRRRRR